MPGPSPLSKLGFHCSGQGPSQLAFLFFLFVCFNPQMSLVHLGLQAAGVAYARGT